MKKLYTLIATCLLLLFVTPLQSIDAGVGHSRSGSSSRSSSSRSSSSPRSSSSGGSSSSRSSYRSGDGYSNLGDSLSTGMNILIMFGVGGFILFMLIKYLMTRIHHLVNLTEARLATMLNQHFTVE